MSTRTSHSTVILGLGLQLHVEREPAPLPLVGRG